MLNACKAIKSSVAACVGRLLGCFETVSLCPRDEIVSLFHDELKGSLRYHPDDRLGATSSDEYP